MRSPLDTGLPLMAPLVALAERLSVAQAAAALGLESKEVLSHAVFARDVLISRAVEQNLIGQCWRPVSSRYSEFLTELSRAITGPWLTLLTSKEREELHHARFIARMHRTRFAINRLGS